MKETKTLGKPQVLVCLRFLAVFSFVGLAGQVCAFESGTIAFYGFNEGNAGACVSSVANADLSSNPPKIPANSFFFVGTPSGAPTFEGGVDEVRFTRAALTPSQFLAPLGKGTGMSIFFR